MLYLQQRISEDPEARVRSYQQLERLLPELDPSDAHTHRPRRAVHLRETRERM